MSKKPGESTNIQHEEAEFARSLNGLFELQRNCNNRRLKTQIREQLFAICINNLDYMSIDTIIELRGTATIAKNRERIDSKIIKSRKIANQVIAELDHCKDFTERIVLYNKCAALAGGYFSVLIVKRLLETLDQSELDSNEGVIFLSNFTVDSRITNLSWETSYIYNELSRNISARARVIDYFFTKEMI